jgi:hypothetical protein
VARPPYVAYFGSWDVNPEVAGIDWQWAPEVTRTAEPTRQPIPSVAELPAGWYAISVNHLRGYRHFGHERPIYTHFLRREPKGYAGYSIYIFQVEEANEQPARSRRQDVSGESVSKLSVRCTDRHAACFLSERSVSQGGFHAAYPAAVAATPAAESHRVQDGPEALSL